MYVFKKGILSQGITVMTLTFPILQAEYIGISYRMPISS